MKIRDLKGITPLNTLGPVALTLVIAIFIVSIGATMTSQMQTSLCSTNGTWGTYPNSSATFPVTGTNEGCCFSVNGSDSYDCDTWATGVSGVNQTHSGLLGLGQFGDWWVVIVLAVILGVVVAVLYFYLGKGLKSGGY